MTPVFLLGGGIALALLGVTVAAYYSGRLLPPSYDTTTLTIQTDPTTTATITARLATTPRTRYIGLSRTPRDEIETKTGMLFVHSRETTHKYVMRGMEYDLDIIFITETGTVTNIETAPADGAGAPYAGRAKYVLELPAHATDSLHITEGDTITDGLPG